MAQVFAFLSMPIDTVTPHLCSLANNHLCGLDDKDRGTYTAKGITKLREALKGSAVTSLKCAAAPECSLSCQRPLTCLLPSYHLRPSPHPHTSVLAPFLSFPPCFLHPFHILIHAMMLPSIVRRVDRGHVLVPDGWITRAPIYPPHPPATSPSQLADQPPRRPGQAGHQRRLGQRRLDRPVS